LGFLDEVAQVAERYSAGINHRELDRVRGDGQVYQLPTGQVSCEQTVMVNGHCGRFGIPLGWELRDAAELAQMQGNEPLVGTTVCAALYRPDTDPQSVYSIQVLGMQARSQWLQQQFDPELWLLKTERQTGLRLVGRIVKVSFAGGIAYLWHLSGLMAGSALGRPEQAPFEVRSSELLFPLGGGMLKLLLVAPAEKGTEGYEALCALLGSWTWVRDA
jgi:hypothetical protein